MIQLDELYLLLIFLIIIYLIHVIYESFVPGMLDCLKKNINFIKNSSLKNSIDKASKKLHTIYGGVNGGPLKSGTRRDFLNDDASFIVDGPNLLHDWYLVDAPKRYSKKTGKLITPSLSSTKQQIELYENIIRCLRAKFSKSNLHIVIKNKNFDKRDNATFPGDTLLDTPLFASREEDSQAEFKKIHTEENFAHYIKEKYPKLYKVNVFKKFKQTKEYQDEREAFKFEKQLEASRKINKTIYDTWKAARADYLKDKLVKHKTKTLVFIKFLEQLSADLSDLDGIYIHMAIDFDINIHDPDDKKFHYVAARDDVTSLLLAKNFGKLIGFPTDLKVFNNPYLISSDYFNEYDTKIIEHLPEFHYSCLTKGQFLPGLDINTNIINMCKILDENDIIIDSPFKELVDSLKASERLIGYRVNPTNNSDEYDLQYIIGEQVKTNPNAPTYCVYLPKNLKYSGSNVRSLINSDVAIVRRIANVPLIHTKPSAASSASAPLAASAPPVPPAPPAPSSGLTKTISYAAALKKPK